MGLDRKVTFAADKTPTWPALAAMLASKQVKVQIRMIDGELAFPDEEPAETWKELRVGIGGGMVTLRREQDGVTLVVWGNADANLQLGWNALTWAIAHLSDGAIQTESSAQSADQFGKSMPMPFVD
jgi:hypothetical protein